MQRSETKQLASVQRLHNRIKARATAKLQSCMLTHDCVLNRLAVAEEVGIHFNSEAEQHRLHIAFGEPTCGVCAVCDRLKASGRPPTVLSAREVMAMRDHWERMVKSARFAAKPHVMAGVELLVKYEPLRDFGDDAMEVVTSQPVSDVDTAALLALGWRVTDGRWLVGLEPAETS